MDIGVLVACLTGLLKHTHLVTSPPVHASIVQLLLAMLSPQVSGGVWVWHAGSCSPFLWSGCERLPFHFSCPQLDYRSMARGGALGPRRVSPAESALVTAVLGTGAAQVCLGFSVALHSDI